MSARKTHAKAGDLVSLAERLRCMQIFRVASAAAAILFGVLAPEALDAGVRELATGTAAYLLVSILGEAVWRLSRRRGLTLFGALLIIDGFYLAWLSYVTGGLTSPLRYMIVLHLVAVALLASYRTGLKLALWHSLLLLAVYHGQEAGTLDPSQAAPLLPGSEMQHLVAFVTVFWLVAIATATFSAVNERELRRRRIDLEALAALATELEDAGDSLSVAEVLLDNVADAFGFERAVLLGTRDDTLSLMAVRGCRRPASSEVHPAAGSVLRRALDRKETILVSQFDATADPWLSELFPSGRNFVVAPLLAEGGAIAVLVVEHALRGGSRIERRAVSMVERFASHAALALRNARLLEQVRRMAATDGLTMIANRRTFEASLSREIARAERTGDELSVLMLDLDHFKLINDSHGHQVGDEVLRKVARVLERNCRDFDTPARYGGDEFVVVLPGCSADESISIAERVRQVIAESEKPLTFTASFGTATLLVSAMDGSSLMRAVDAALYVSKRSGGNRVTGSPAPEAAAELRAWIAGA